VPSLVIAVHTPKVIADVFVGGVLCTLSALGTGQILARG
jgi:hypothetical protein